MPPTEFKINNRIISLNHPPLVIAEIGINHNGEMKKALQMVDAAHKAGCECVKFQCHVIDDEYGEMVPNDVVPGNATESIYTMMQRCQLSFEKEAVLKNYVESLGMMYLSTPFSRAAVDRLEKLNIPAYKIGSGECNNYPLIEYIAKKGKPIILSTGMNNISSIRKSVEIIEKHNVPYALLHCVSMYPTPYNKVSLKAMHDLATAFEKNDEYPVIGLSDHSIGIYTALGAVVVGASILEKHFTADKSWEGPDIPISIDPKDLKELIIGSKAVWEASNEECTKQILPEEQSTINFAYAYVVAIKDIKAGEIFTEQNIWVKRPGTGEIKAEYFNDVIGKTATGDIKKDDQIKYTHVKA